MRESKDPKYLRFEIVRYAQQHGVKPAARALGTTAKTMRQSGMQFIAFAGERALNYSTLFFYS
ncbi:MAG: hypothetical protein ONB46_12500 [candidate division KSB1 bacterium]|nr:hypothetical protein [candidate division KSB1 bacterium]MDZ7366539.1 hypothetical protein [candidate division KSB1 bacterium]